jgi:hypothetical protein
MFSVFTQALIYFLILISWTINNIFIFSSFKYEMSFESTYKSELFIFASDIIF